MEGPPEEVFVPQYHAPGYRGLSDFAAMGELCITIANVPFARNLYHFVPAFQRCEQAGVVEGGENFETLSKGRHNPLWQAAGVPQKHRSDSLSAAFENLADDEDFTARYTALLEHYEMAGTRNNGGLGHKNGSVESSRRFLMREIEQVLPRGHRDFENRAAYDLLDAVHTKRDVPKIRLANPQQHIFFGGIYMKSTVSGLLDEALDSRIQNLVYGAHLEADFKNVFATMTEVNQAHVVMLAETNIVAHDVAKTLAGVLLDLEATGPSAFPLDPAREETYFNYEAKVIDVAGPEVGGAMHVARSRNDLKATIERMRSRNACLDILDALATVRESALARAEKFAFVVMPGYTHMQPAQPTTFGSFLLGFAKALERDQERFTDSYRRINLNPLGSCAFAGTSFPIDRRRTQELLGFDGLIEHNLDAVASRDFVVELLAACTMLGLTWSRFVQDLYFMITHEFQTVSFPDRVFGTSSIMPQKRNPTVIEHLRGRAARLAGAMQSTMMAIKGTTFSVSFDIVSDALRGYHESLTETIDGLTLLDLVVGTAEPDADRMLELVRRNFASVTDLTDSLVREAKLSFREAHHVVGATVRLAIENSLTSDRITSALIDQAATGVLGRPLSVPEDIVKRSLDPTSVVAARKGIGGPAPREVLRMIDGARQRLDSDREWVRVRRFRLDAAKKKLREEISTLAGR